MAASMSIVQVAGSGTCVNDEPDVEPPSNVAMSNVSPVPKPMFRVPWTMEVAVKLPESTLVVPVPEIVPTV
jgi:hypothetical protein